MSVPNIEETVSSQTEPATRKKPRRGLWVLAGIVIVLALTAGGAYFGYQDAIRVRLAKQSSNVAIEATTQFQLGLQDLAAKNYLQARDRFKYVISIDPTFPGARDKMAEAMLQLSITATPTLAPTPTLTPTPDTRGVDELYNQAKQSLANKKWDQAIQDLDSLRKANRELHAIEVDGMYYVALRNRGADKILKLGQLQEGLYDLALAERFGPLDGEANGYRVWANLYLTGAAYWKVDWAKAVDYFGQIYPYYPGLRDTSGVTATERFRLASIGLGDQLMTNNKPCDALKQYQAALDLSPDPQVDQKAKSAGDACAGPPKPTTEPTAAATTLPADVPTSAAPTQAPSTPIPPTDVPPTEAPPTPVPPTDVPPTQAPTAPPAPDATQPAPQATAA
jgi:tetratricopeptide (TPR) repeat protein